MKELFELIQKYRNLFIREFRQARPAWILGMAVSITALVPAYLQQKIFDVAIPLGNLGVVGLILTGLVVSYVLQGAMETLLGFMEARVVEQADFRLKGVLADQLLCLPQVYYDRTPPGEIQKVWEDSSKLTDCFQILSFQAGRSLFSLLCYLPLLFWISPLLTLVKLLSFPLGLGLNQWFSSRDRSLETGIWAHSAQLGTEFQEGILGVRTVKAYGGELSQSRRWKRKLLSLRREGWKRRMVQALWGIFSQLIQQIAGALFFLTAAWGLMEGWLSFGKFLAFNALAGLGLGALQGLVETLGRLGRNLNPVTRVDGVLSLVPEVRRSEVSSGNGALHLRGEVEFRQVSFRYGEDRVVLDKVQIHLAPGTKTAVVGPSGSGKSTLVNLLMGFYRPSSGTVLFDGVPMDSYRREDLRSRIGLVLQENFFFHRTLRENLLLGRSRSDGEIYQALERAQALEFILKIPGRINALYGAHGTGLSGGQKQRLAIARAFLQDPAVLILDEATSALDPGSEKAVQKALEELCAKRTSLVIAHRLTTVLDAHNICYLAGGVVGGQGTHRRLMEGCGGYRELWAAQRGSL